MIPSLSRLTLGTAQFGFTYGVANRSGVPTQREVQAMLESAAEAGVNCLDTARGYGDSEKVLGEALEATGLHEHFQVVTKIEPGIPTDLPRVEAKKALRESVMTSLTHLRCERLPIVLLHRDTCPAYLEILAELRDEGLMDYCGVSVASQANAERLLLSANLDAIQAPINVLDSRFTQAAHTVAERGGLVFARSCYLQGLLLLENTQTPSHLLAVEPARDFFRQLAAQYGLSLSELLLRAMLGHQEISSVVVGMENLLQLRENLQIFQSPPLPAKILEEVRSYSPSLPAWLVDPSQWSEQAGQ